MVSGNADTMHDFSHPSSEAMLPLVLWIEHGAAGSARQTSNLRRAGFDVRVIATASEALAEHEPGRASIILIDDSTAGRDAMSSLALLRQRLPATPVMLAATNFSIQAATEAMRAGAYDYLEKPFSAERLVGAARAALAGVGSAACPPLAAATGKRPGSLIGSSAAMQAVCRTLETVATSKATIFLTGESGTGKEVCAEAIHRASGRAGKPFVAINCAAIPKDLVESELFGHLRGAFTGAVSNRVGAVAQAHRGTLFLDEICEMDVNLQSKLLRFLQTGTLRRIGASEVEQVDVRIICATNRDPSAEIAAGRFREDLYYRLYVVPIHLPPLRERDEDALEIARSFLADYAREEGKGFARLAPCAEAAILAYPWPGNVRELQNVLRSAVVLNDGAELAAAHLPEPICSAALTPKTGAAAAPGNTPDPAAVGLTAGGGAVQREASSECLAPPSRTQEPKELVLAHWVQAVAVMTAFVGFVDTRRRAAWLRGQTVVARILRPFSAERLVGAARAALAGVGSAACPPLAAATGKRPDSLIGSSAAMQAVCRTLETVATSKATIFLTGESGTGKEVCAEAIHRASGRAGKPFVAINCAAIPKDLVESELFGHLRGAFTGAVSNRVGAVAQAHRGTLFLDEICEMDVNLQSKLLRFLQTGTLRRIGASEVEQVDVRIICATNRDPSAEIAAGRFREDLYYRLYVVPIHLPPLRERDEDALEIARSFLADYAREEGKGFARLAPCAEAAILAYPWPGNVRELQNVLRSAVVLNDGAELAAAHLPEPICSAALTPKTSAAAAPGNTPDPAAVGPNNVAAMSPDPVAFGDQTPIEPLWKIEKCTIEMALRKYNNNIQCAAKALGISSSTIYRKRQVWYDLGNVGNHLSSNNSVIAN